METLLAKISIMLVPALFAVTLHEVSHGYVADRFGDPTARLLGRLTLNPLRHLDPIGTLALLWFGFGWARPVPVNFQNLRRPGRDMIWVAAAGPLTNFAVAAFSALLLRTLHLVPQVFAAQDTLSRVLEPLGLMIAISIYLNILLGIFNLLPIPPLDGGRVLTGILPATAAQWLARVEPFGFVLVILLVFFTDLLPLLLAPVSALVTLFAGPQLFMVERAIQILFPR